MEHELERISWGLLGVSNVGKKEKSSHCSRPIFYYCGEENDSEVSIDFFIHKKIPTKVKNTRAISQYLLELHSTY